MHGNRMLKMTPSVVLGRVPPCDVPQGYVAVVPLPAASLGCLLSILRNRPGKEKVEVPAKVEAKVVWRSALHAPALPHG